MGKKFDRVVYTTGNITVNTANVWANLANGLDLTLSGIKRGDIVGASLSSIWNIDNSSGYIDVVSVVDGVPVNSWAEANLEGIGAPSDAKYGFMGWLGQALLATPIMGTVFKVVAESDIDDGGLLMRFRAKTGTASNKLLLAGANNPIVVSAVNHGQ